MSSRFSSMSEELFQILKGTGKVLTLFDSQGRKVYEPSAARKFFAEPDKMMISVNENDSDSSINLYLSAGADLKEVSHLINTLRAMVSRYNVILDVKKYGKELSPKDFAYQTIGEGSMWGSTKTSYQKIGQTKLVVRHCAPVREDVMGSRARNILGLFVETKAGERLKFPVCHLSGARAWAKHLSEGGSAHDELGSYIVELAQEAMDLTKVSRYVHYARKNLAEEAQGVRAQLRLRIAEVRKELQSLGRSRGYSVALESKVYENRTIIKETRQEAVELECQRLRELLDIDTNHALAETIRPVALITLGENIMTTDMTKFSQVLALESVDELIECFSSEYGFEEGNHWARHGAGLALLPEAVLAAEDFLNLTESEYEIFENGGDAFETFAAKWFADRKSISGQDGISPDDHESKDKKDSKDQKAVLDLATGLKAINAGQKVANVTLPAQMPGFADRMSEVRYKLGLFLDAGAAMQNDALWTFISTIVDKLQDGQKLSQIESIFAGKLVASLDNVAEGLGEQDDVLEYNDPTSYEAGASADRAEGAENEIHDEFEGYLMQDFINADYPFFLQPCDQDEPMSTHDVKGDLHGFLNREMDRRLDTDNNEVGDHVVDLAMQKVVALAQKNGWTFDSPIAEAAVSAIAMGDMVATDFGPAEVLEVGKTKVKVMLQHGGSKVLFLTDVEKVDNTPGIKEMDEMNAWFEQFDPQAILAPISEADVDHDGFEAMVIGAFKDGETVATISGWSMVKPDVIEDMLKKAGALSDQGQMEVAEQEVTEAPKADVYHSIFVQLEDGKWAHHFDADDKEDARSEVESIKNNGEKCKVFKVPKAKANWGTGPGQVDPHQFVVDAMAVSALKKATPVVAEEEAVTEVAATPRGFDQGNMGMNDPEGFVKFVEDNCGWAVAKQASDILDGEAYHEQNDAALTMIMNSARHLGEAELEQSIKQYLATQTMGETESSDDQSINEFRFSVGQQVKCGDETGKIVKIDGGAVTVQVAPGYNIHTGLADLELAETADMGDDFINDVKKDDAVEEAADVALLATLKKHAGL